MSFSHKIASFSVISAALIFSAILYAPVPALGADGSCVPMIDAINASPHYFEEAISFPDIPEGSLLSEAVGELSARGVIKGYPGGLFHPERPVNRAEALKMILLASSSEGDAFLPGPSFPDVPAGSWFETYVLFAYSNGIVHGYPDGYFRPEGEVNAPEFVKILAGSFEIDESYPNIYHDVGEDDWYFPYAGIAGEFSLFPDRGTFFFPGKPVTREEAVIALYELIKNGGCDDEGDGPGDEDPDDPGDDTTSEDTHGELDVTPADIADEPTDEMPVLWEGTLRLVKGGDGVIYTIRQLSFRNDGNALDGDLGPVALTIEEGSGGETTIISGEFMEDGFLIFGNDESLDLSLMKGEEILMRIKGNAAASVSGLDTYVDFSLDVSEIRAENPKGSPVTILAGEDIAYGKVYLRQNGEGNELGDPVLLTAFGKTPDSRILISGTEGNIVSGFEFESNLESIKLQDLTFSVVETDTTSTLGRDVPHDSTAIDSLSLFFVDGTPVLKENGENASSGVVDADGKIKFQNLDLVVEEDTPLVLYASVDLNDIAGNTSPRSGMAFSIKLSADSGDHTLKGITSESDYDIGDVLADSNTPKIMVVLKNEIAIVQEESQEILIPGNGVEILKFRILKSSQSEAFMRQLTLEISLTEDPRISNIALYNDDNELIAFDPFFARSGPVTLVMGTIANEAVNAGYAVDADNLAEFPAGSGKMYESVGGDSEVYTVKADIAGINRDDKITVVLRVNGSEPGTSSDGLVWRDEGIRSGEEGMDIQWVPFSDAMPEGILDQVAELGLDPEDLKNASVIENVLKY